MVNTGLEHFCSMPRESFPTGGRPTLEGRFNVRLCVAEKSHEALAPGTLLTAVHSVWADFGPNG